MGATHVPLRRVDGARVLDAVASFDVTTLCAASTVLVGMLEALRHRPAFHARRPVRVATAAGAPTPEILEQVEGRLGWTVIHLYGMTETSAFVTMSEEPPDAHTLSPAERAARKARQGVPLLLAGRVRVVHPDGSDVRPDGLDMGEVICRGNVIMEGYDQDPEGTRAALRDGWLHTGDLAVRHPDGSLEIRDRIKDVVKSGGEQIPSLEVERVLALHPAILEAAVVARPDPYWGETPMAFLVARDGAERPTDEEIRTHCRTHLSHFKVPRWFAWLEALPRNGAGKVQKSLLRTWARETAQEGTPLSAKAQEGHVSPEPPQTD